MKASTTLAIADQHAISSIASQAHITNNPINTLVMLENIARTQLRHVCSQVFLILRCHDSPHVHALEGQHATILQAQIIERCALHQNVQFILHKRTSALPGT
jgi:hypothetical protein